MPDGEVSNGGHRSLFQATKKPISSLMTMIACVEQAAAIRGDKGMFITLTTPSKYHPTRAVGKNSPKVHFNHKWDDEAYTPKDGQRYLVKLFSKIRTAFKDAGLQAYGVRVVEPQHDATPHLHMMLFTSKKTAPAGDRHHAPLCHG